MTRRYASPDDFKRSLEAHLANEGHRTGEPIARLRQLVVFDRFLAHSRVSTLGRASHSSVRVRSASGNALSSPRVVSAYIAGGEVERKAFRDRGRAQSIVGARTK
jgi:hypothetical protein